VGKILEVEKAEGEVNLKKSEVYTRGMKWRNMW